MTEETTNKLLNVAMVTGAVMLLASLFMYYIAAKGYIQPPEAPTAFSNMYAGTTILLALFGGAILLPIKVHYFFLSGKADAATKGSKGRTE